jgi:hypothetical protein
MEEVLRSLQGRKVDVSFGSTSVVRGSVSDVSSGLLSLDDEEGKRIYVSIERIAFFLEVKNEEPRAGFLNNAG